MAGILSALGRGNQQKDPMRESAALTTVYLLEQNQKFEQYMRQKVDELESRVAAQQARLSTRAETEERELWAALESFEAPPDTTQTVGLVAADEIVVETVPEPEDELMAWGDASDVDEPVNVGSIDEPEEIPDYLALMSGAVTEPVGLVGVEPEIDPPAVDDLFEPGMAEFDEPHPATSGNEADLAIKPEDEPDSTTEEAPLQAVTTAPQNGSSPWPDEAAELPVDDANRADWLENEIWPGQPYETFQVNRPEAEAVEEIWPDLVLAEEVELLGRQPATDGATSTVTPAKSPPIKATENEVATQPGEETEQAWQTPLSDGRKGEWS